MCDPNAACDVHNAENAKVIAMPKGLATAMRDQ
jgi:hypothetical protein